MIHSPSDVPAARADPYPVPPADGPNRVRALDGLRGATSNPSILEKAITGSTDYLDARHDALFCKASDNLLAAVAERRGDSRFEGRE